MTQQAIAKDHFQTNVILKTFVWCLILSTGCYGRPDVQDKVVQSIRNDGEGTFLVTFKSIDLSRAVSPLAMLEEYNSKFDNGRETTESNSMNMQQFMENDRYFETRGLYVYEQISKHHGQTKAVLEKLVAAKNILSSIPISNSFVVKANQQVFDLLQTRDDIIEIHSNEPFKVELPKEDPTVERKQSLFNPISWIPGSLTNYFLGAKGSSAKENEYESNVQWNIKKIGASDIWTFPNPNSRGKGVLYAIADTGVAYLHPIIKHNYAGLKSDGKYDHNYVWYDGVRKPIAASQQTFSCFPGSKVPCDDNGHGTHALSTAVGSNGYGVAPDAKWMACRNMDNGVGRPETYLNCLNFFLAPFDLNGNNPKPELRPHVVGNSYGCPDSEGCSKHALTAAVDALRAAGVFMSVSAGNDGPECSTINDPPAVEKSAIVVAAVDSNDQLADFSSRGPVIIDASPYRKPDVAAPGVQILAAFPRDTYKRLSGTSMASPHVSGTVILMIAMCPCIEGDVDRLQHFLQMSAIGKKPPLTIGKLCGGDRPDSIPNNYYGYGRIDALAAVNVCRAFCERKKLSLMD